MTDKEKIRAYVKRLQKPEGYGDYWKGYDSALNDILSFIDSLPEEPVSEDLDKEIDRYFNTEGIPVTEGALRDTARHFAEWQRDQILNCNATLLRTFELGKIEMKHQILKTMDLGEPPYLISVEKAYYDVKKLLEG